MNEEKNNLKTIILEFLSEENLSPNKFSDPKLEFGYKFIFPPGRDPLGRPIGQKMLIFKPKQKDMVIISIATQISKIHIDALNSLDHKKKMQFFMDIRKHFLLKDVLYRIDIPNYRYEISEQIFFSRYEIISKNALFKAIRKIFDTMVYSNLILNEYCEGKIKPEDLDRAKDFSSGSDFTLYS